MAGFKGRKILFFSIILGGLFLKCQCAGAVKIFSKDKYSIPQGKSILLSPISQSPDKKFNWVSEDPAVVSVDSRGIAYARSCGKAVINACDKHGKNKEKCVVEVGGRDPFRIVFASNSKAKKGENFKINAVTYKDAEVLKYEITGANYSKTFECHKKTNYLDYYLWESDISLPHNGRYHVTSYAKVGKLWKTCKEANTDILISEEYDGSAASLKEKYVSSQCSKFICLWEGTCPHAYKDTVGILTIGCGKRIHPYEIFYNNLSPIEISNMFMHVLDHSNYSKKVNEFLIRNNIKFNQRQFDALVSFSYNIGYGWLNLGNRLAQVMLDCAKNQNKDGACYGIVNSHDGLRIRSEPSISAKKLGVLKNGEKVDILDTKKVNEKWYRIKTKEGTHGYCYGDYMDTVKLSKGEKNLNNIDRNKFIKEFLQYHHAGGTCNKGLLARRIGELDIFFKGKYLKKCNIKKSSISYDIPDCAKKLF